MKGADKLTKADIYHIKLALPHDGKGLLNIDSNGKLIYVGAQFLVEITKKRVQKKLLKYGFAEASKYENVFRLTEKGVELRQLLKAHKDL